MSRTTVYRLVPNIAELRPPLDKQEVVKRYFQTFSLSQVREEFQLSWERLRDLLQSANVQVMPPQQATKVVTHIRRHFDTPLSQLAEEIIEGGLLGDMSLHSTYHNSSLNFPAYQQAVRFLRQVTKEGELVPTPMLVDQFNRSNQTITQSPCARLRIHKALQEEKWLQYLRSLLGQEGLASQVTRSQSKKTGVISCHLTSDSNVDLWRLHQQWYQSRKGVPSNLQLTPTKVLVWFVGDGTATKYRVKFSSHGFTQQDNLYLRITLEQEMGIQATVRQEHDSRNGQTYYYIDITGSKNLQLFYSYLGLAESSILSTAVKLFPKKFPATT